MSKEIVECPYCKRFNRWGHYVPPSLGEPGFSICKSSWKTAEKITVSQFREEVRSLQSVDLEALPHDQLLARMKELLAKA